MVYVHNSKHLRDILRTKCAAINPICRICRVKLPAAMLQLVLGTRFNQVSDTESSCNSCADGASERPPAVMKTSRTKDSTKGYDVAETACSCVRD